MNSFNGLNSVPPFESLSLREGMLLCSPLLGSAPFSTALGPLSPVVGRHAPLTSATNRGGA